MSARLRALLGTPSETVKVRIEGVAHAGDMGVLAEFPDDSKLVLQLSRTLGYAASPEDCAFGFTI